MPFISNRGSLITSQLLSQCNNAYYGGVCWNYFFWGSTAFSIIPVYTSMFNFTRPSANCSFRRRSADVMLFKALLSLKGIFPIKIQIFSPFGNTIQITPRKPLSLVDNWNYIEFYRVAFVYWQNFFVSTMNYGSICCVYIACEGCEHFHLPIVSS